MRIQASSLVLFLCCASAWAGPFAPAAGQPGSTAIANSSPLIVGWATEYHDLIRGPQNITNPAGLLASFGSGGEALGFADGNASRVVSLGDGGRITLSFGAAITDGPGADFAVFENGFADTFLELALVEVSSNGTDFVRFPAVSLTQFSTQVGSFGALDPTDLDNLAGKYRAGFGTPFDLGQIVGISPLVDANRISFVRIVDAVGSIDPAYAMFDSLGHPINEPFSTNFASGGFDLDGVGVIHFVPEPATILLAAFAGVLSGLRGIKLRRWRRRCERLISAEDVHPRHAQHHQERHQRSEMQRRRYSPVLSDRRHHH